MEFGFLTQGYLPAHVRQGDPNAEHQVLMDDLEVCLAAEAAGFKYIWISEHHFLDEYSHISASDVFLGALGALTTTAHIGSGIFNPLPKVHHPAAVAERVAMLDHLTEGRFEFGVGRGAGSTEVTGFHTEITDVSETKKIFEETIGEFVKMWTQDVYEGFSGTYWDMPPRKVLPKPYGALHPGIWYAAGNTSSFEMCGRKGMGALGFSLDELPRTDAAIKSYKKAVAECDEPVGAWVNDNLIVANGFNSIAEDRDQARRDFLQGGNNYQMSQVFRYHDTFPRPEGFPVWPEVMPDLTEEALEGFLELGAAIVGDPDDAVAQIRRWEATGADQFLMLRGVKSKEETLRMIKLMGEHVIPKFDTDPVHRTTRLRQAAAGADATR
ncbi:LLM class flavin-dependent oxidoreductase [Pseudonocardia abyssalis]|uniref:LLM class flavin-dependent oxidoreductase n=1 Tax=Pseudonocardia abyssalis TaxID=2792008 RepID=A0ABS6UWM1_9PSEU|nr:LLM class flavin-dependent oxidoreductase [Pseudonocardia abyssalis]MBW0114677.1 LLM class flavin-dependent oxidoreductase [Pseudonocardia abyssalis]MBW0136672.1 LLM class flavin-dependent oxidoreductase [Pseudonocardia abyssalis]